MSPEIDFEPDPKEKTYQEQMSDLDKTLSETPIKTPKPGVRKSKVKYRLIKEGDLIQLIIDINTEKIAVPDHVKLFFQNNTTDRGAFRGKRDYRKGGRTDGTIRQVLNALVDSEQLFVKK